jgi:NADPH-dependent 2,4-dienoyl-CoA reductase/sulfur reductase-like enzyme
MMNQHYQYLIVGGGIAADAAIRGIRDIDAGGGIGLIGDDPEPPYKRPWLSKALWKGKSLDKVWLNTPEVGVDLHLGRRVERAELTENRLLDDLGNTYTFDRLLLATGVRPRRMAPPSDRIIAYRTLADFRQLHQLTRTGYRFAVVGSGFIGSEIAAALAMTGKRVDLIFPEAAIGARLFPPALAEFVTNRYRDEGVTLHSGRTVAQLSERADRVVVDLADLDGAAAGSIEVDAVITGIGAEPNTDLAATAGLQIENGIVVDRRLQTRRPGVYAAGDVARFFQPALRRYLRIEHEDNARRMGRAAGRAMAGQPEPYDHLPSFYSDLFDLGYEAVGEIDSRHQTIEDWSDPYREGVVYYTRDDRVRGVLLWNVWDKTNEARELIASAKPHLATVPGARLALA